MSAATNTADESFQPGQLGTRHLLGIITVAAIILGVSSARLRMMTRLDVGLVALHWAIVLALAGIPFSFGCWRRRRDRAAAGELLLRVLCKPMTETRRTITKWLLTGLVVLDGVFISAVVYPALDAPKNPTGGLTSLSVVNAVFRGVMPQTAVTEGMIWGLCMNHWLTNIYWVEFRTGGILTYAGYYPWHAMSRIGWSPVYPNRLSLVLQGRLMHITTDPASHDAVNQLLEKIQAQMREAGPARPAGPTPTRA